jgi:galactokinase
VSTVTWHVPGRIEVLGKHTDYAGGRVLVCAIDRAVSVTATPGIQGIYASSTASDEPVSVVAGQDPGLPAGHWGRYVQTVVDRLTANFGSLIACRLSVSTTLPLASGMSSSSALLCGVALALADLNGISDTDAWHRNTPDGLALAGYLARVENGLSWGDLAGARGVGTAGGSEDHTAMLCAVPGELSQFAFDPVERLADVPLPAWLSFVVAVSGVPAEKTAGALHAYNSSSHATREILARWNAGMPNAASSLATAVVADAGEGRLGRLVADDSRLVARLRHFIAESTVLVPGAAHALSAGDLNGFGALVDESQWYAETDLGNQVPETVDLAASARELGAHAASAFGAGFGGSVWALVDTQHADEFATQWLDLYRRRFPDRTAADVLVTRPAAAAERLYE